MTYLLLITALCLSGIAAYYSIAGLAAIFAAAVVPIVVMGSVLEVSKLVVASWLYRNWKQIPVLFKSYFMVALIILMTLTSMGIFGFLSKAHLDQAVPSGDVAAKLALIDEKIKTEKETINESRKILAQLDSQVDQTMSRTMQQTDDSSVRRSIGIRKSQANERKQLRSTIEKAQTQIAQLNQERQPVASELRQVEAEVGPVKYIAALIYGDNPDQNILEKAVRIVILMIVAVFDPLAVLMLVAYNWTLKNTRKEEDPKPEGWHQEWVPDSEAWPPYEPDFPDVEEPLEFNDPEISEDYAQAISGYNWDPSLELDAASKTIEEEVEELQPPVKEKGRYQQALEEQLKKLTGSKNN
jgi:hypothetical protein